MGPGKRRVTRRRLPRAVSERELALALDGRVLDAVTANVSMVQRRADRGCLLCAGADHCRQDRRLRRERERRGISCSRRPKTEHRVPYLIPGSMTVCAHRCNGRLPLYRLDNGWMDGRIQDGAPLYTKLLTRLGPRSLFCLLSRCCCTPIDIYMTPSVVLLDSMRHGPTSTPRSALETPPVSNFGFIHSRLTTPINSAHYLPSHVLRKMDAARNPFCPSTLSIARPEPPPSHPAVRGGGAASAVSSAPEFYSEGAKGREGSELSAPC